MKKMVVIIMLVCVLVFTGIANTESVADGIEVITSLYATERATGIDNYGRHFMYLIWKDDLKRVDYTEVTDLIDKCDGWNGLNLYGNKNGIIGVFWADDNVPAFYEGTSENEKTDIREAFTVDEGELKATWVVEGASLGSADKYGAFKPVRIVWIKGETNYRLVVVGEGANDTPKPITPTPTPTLEPTKEPTPTSAPTTEPTEEPTATPAPTLEPTEEPTATPAPTLEPIEEPTATPAPTLEPIEEPTATPAPSLEPIEEPTATPAPSLEPIEEPTVTPVPSLEPIEEPTVTPVPSLEPIEEPTVTPVPSLEPIEEPTKVPEPTLVPDDETTSTPKPSLEPNGESKATTAPTASPSITSELGEKDVSTTARPELGNDEDVENTEILRLELKEAETLADETKMDFN